MSKRYIRVLATEGFVADVERLCKEYETTSLSDAVRLAVRQERKLRDALEKAKSITIPGKNEEGEDLITLW